MTSAVSAAIGGVVPVVTLSGSSLDNLSLRRAGDIYLVRSQVE